MPIVKELLVNGAKKPVDADGERSLLSVLRDDLGLTGAKYGCGEGECGACTVLLDAKRVRSCITRVGCGRASSRPTAEPLIPGVPYPPWRAPHSRNASCTGCRLSPAAIPSTVPMSSPSALPSPVIQDTAP